MVLVLFQSYNILQQFYAMAVKVWVFAEGNNFFEQKSFVITP